MPLQRFMNVLLTELYTNALSENQRSFDPSCRTCVQRVCSDHRGAILRLLLHAGLPVASVLFASSQLLAVPRFPRNTYGRRAFSVAGPMSWNSLQRILSGIQRAAQTVLGVYLKRWWRGTVVESRSLAGELSLSCARPAADG